VGGVVPQPGDDVEISTQHFPGVTVSSAVTLTTISCSTNLILSSSTAALALGDNASLQASIVATLTFENDATLVVSTNSVLTVGTVRDTGRPGADNRITGPGTVTVLQFIDLRGCAFELSGADIVFANQMYAFTTPVAPLASGVCSCARGYTPVCGVDGRTYVNECQLACSGVALARQGDCGTLVGMRFPGVNSQPVATVSPSPPAASGAVSFDLSIADQPNPPQYRTVGTVLPSATPPTTTNTDATGATDAILAVLRDAWTIAAPTLITPPSVVSGACGAGRLVIDTATLTLADGVEFLHGDDAAATSVVVSGGGHIDARGDIALPAVFVAAGGRLTMQVGLVQSRSLASANHHLLCRCYRTLTHSSFLPSLL
jgi:hypothetical protein